MLGTTHRPPAIPRDSKVETLRRADDKANVLKADTLVTVINRGRQVLTRKFDGEDYDLKPFTADGGDESAPSMMAMPYAAALHFQKHCVVPGTRNPDSGTFAAESFLGILDTDDADQCVPFTEEECRTFGQAIEAIERLDPETTKVIDVRKNQSRRSGRAGLGNGRGTMAPRQTTTGDEADREAAEIALEAMKAPDGVSEEIQSEAEEGEAEFARAATKRR